MAGSLAVEERANELPETDGPWPLPAGWCWTNTNTVAAINPPTSFDTLDPASEMPFIPMAAVAEETGKIDLSARRLIRDVAKGYVRFMEGDVIFAKITPCMENGKVAPVLGLPGDHAAGSTEFHVFRPSATDQRYLWYWLVGRGFRGRAKRNMSGSAGQLRVPVDWLREADFPLAPLAEQRRIVARVDELFAEIAEGEAALAEARKGLSTFRRALLKAAVTGKLTEVWRAANPVAKTGHDLLARIAKGHAANAPARGRGRRNSNTSPVDTAALPELPEGWAWAKVGDLLEFVTSGSRGWKEYYSDDGAIFVRAQNINSGVLDLSDVAFVRLPSDAEGLRTRLKANDLLVTITGANVTVSARVTEDLQEAYVNQHVALLRPTLPETSEWILLWLQAYGAGKSQLVEAAYGAGKPGLNLDNIREVSIAFPPPAEASEILRRVSHALSASADTLVMLDAEATDAARLKQSVLKAAFEGRLVPHDPADEPATALLTRLAANLPAVRARRGRARKSDV
jgi:type I restriction enzyme S subunit